MFTASLSGQAASHTARAGGDFPSRVQREAGAGMLNECIERFSGVLQASFLSLIPMTLVSGPDPCGNTA